MNLFSKIVFGGRIPARWAPQAQEAAPKTSALGKARVLGEEAHPPGLGRHVIRFALATLLMSLTVLAQAETAGVDETGVPAFAVAKLSIAKMGVFLDQNGAYANHIIPNAGPLAKIAMANALFKLPVDESLNFEGPVQIYFLAPITLTANQETAMALPVADAEKFKKNVISVYGDATDQNGAMAFTVPQPIPLPDKTLLVKIIKDKALLAPSAEVLKQLEVIAAAPAAALAGNADAEVIVSVPALKKFYGGKVEDAMQAGAFLASESVEGLKTVTDQLDTIIKTMWQVGAVELRVFYDKDSNNVSAELAIVPLKETKLADIFANPPPGLEGKNTTLLVMNAPINGAYRLNGQAAYALMKKLGLPKDMEKMQLAFLNLLDGEITLAIDPSKQFGLASQRVSTDLLSKKAEAFSQAIADDRNNQLPDGIKFVISPETEEYRGVKIILHKAAAQAKDPDANILTHDSTGYLAVADINGLAVLGKAIKSEVPIKSLIDAIESKSPVSPELKAAFETPQPGTLVFVSARLLEMAASVGADFLPDNVTKEQIVGGLKDAPVSLSVFIQGGKAGLRGTLPGDTAGALFAVYSRLKRNGVNLGELIGVVGKKHADEGKVPGSIPAPPPEK